MKKPSKTASVPWIKDKLGITPLDLTKERPVPMEIIDRMEKMPPR